MIIYGALLIPIAAAIFMYWRFQRQILWWEFLIPFASSLIFILIMKMIIEVANYRSKEYWGSFVKQIEYYEDWDEWITMICTRQYPCGTDANGNTSYCTEVYDCSYRQYHSAQWWIVTTTDEDVRITEDQYNELKRKYSNEKFTELNRDYYHDDGDKYSCTWQGDSIKAAPVTTLHYYENRIKVADQSVFHFQKVTDDDIAKYALKSYPSITDRYKMNAVIGDSSSDATIANKKLQYTNGLLGHKKEVRCFLLVFKNQPVDAAYYQEWLWSGGNMNEFVLCLGMDNSRNIKWSKVLSWTTNETLKADVQSYVASNPNLTLSQISDYLQVSLGKDFVRRDFKEFDYLTVEPPTWAVILTYLFTMAVNFFIGRWVVFNDYVDAY